MTNQKGATLAVGLVLLTLVTLLGLAGASAAHVERQLAQDETFRENAASAASAGIEMAMRAISTSTDPASVPPGLTGAMADTGAGASGRYEVTLRFVGMDPALPQLPGAHLAGAHFDILSTGYSARRAVDRQRAAALWVVAAPGAVAADCEPLAPRHCHALGTIERLGWQRVPE